MSSSDSGSRFIPREELEGFATWRPHAFDDATSQSARSPKHDAQRAAGEQAALQGARQAGYQDGYRDGLVALESFKQAFATQMSAQLGALVAAFDAEFMQLESAMADGVAQCATALARQVGWIHVYTNVRGREQHGLDSLCGDCRHEFGARGEFAAHHLARQGGGTGRHAVGHRRFELLEFGIEGRYQRAELCAHLCGEGLLETLQRDQAVAVAVLVPGLARALHRRLIAGRALCIAFR